MSYTNIPDDEAVAGDAIDVAFIAVVALLCSTAIDSLLLGVVGMALLGAGAVVALLGGRV